LVQRKLGSASSRIAVRKLAANRTVYINHVNAAGHIRNPGLEAAKLRRAAGVIAGGMRNLTRGEAGMRICF